ncbi:MAG: hypothetical protein KDK39_15550 [Leptospiraceae bacterium]|nr:hypothetical protein [Leptospiraceae bacterium]
MPARTPFKVLSKGRLGIGPLPGRLVAHWRHGQPDHLDLFINTDLLVKHSKRAGRSSQRLLSFTLQTTELVIRISANMHRENGVLYLVFDQTNPRLDRQKVARPASVLEGTPNKPHRRRYWRYHGPLSLQGETIQTIGAIAVHLILPDCRPGGFVLARRKPGWIGYWYATRKEKTCLRNQLDIHSVSRIGLGIE